MILAAHMLMGAAVASLTDNLYLGFFVAFMSHYALDAIPHVEYSIDALRNKQWSKSAADVVKVFLDFFGALAVIFLFSGGKATVYVGALAAVIPDALTIMGHVFPNRFLQWHYAVHGGTLHYLTKQKKFPIAWRIATQVATAAAALVMLTISK